jgi:hypothetical protein
MQYQYCCSTSFVKWTESINTFELLFLVTPKLSNTALQVTFRHAGSSLVD